MTDLMILGWLGLFMALTALYLYGTMPKYRKVFLCFAFGYATLVAFLLVGAYHAR